VLDLDETLVSAYESSSLPAIVRTQAVEAGLHCFDMECISSDKDVEGKQKVNHVTVFERPGLHEFLQKTSEFADLILFTAGLEGYARPLVDRIDVHNRFRLRLYRPSTVTTYVTLPFLSMQIMCTTSVLLLLHIHALRTVSLLIGDVCKIS
jgi:RNA polymerase II subunit A small phosphatase-like protein